MALRAILGIPAFAGMTMPLRGTVRSTLSKLSSGLLTYKNSGPLTFQRWVVCPAHYLSPSFFSRRSRNSWPISAAIMKTIDV